MIQLFDEKLPFSSRFGWQAQVCFSPVGLVSCVGLLAASFSFISTLLLEKSILRLILIC